MSNQDIFKEESAKVVLRDYQLKMIDDLKRSISSGHRRIICQLHVGGGKTVVAGQIAKNAAEKLKRSLFLAPRRQLVYQTIETYEKFGINTGVIMAGENPFSMPFAQVGSIDTITRRVKSGKMSLPDASIVIPDEAHAVFSAERLKLLENYPLVIAITATPCLANGKGMGSFYTDIVEGPTMLEMVNNGYLVPMRYFIGEAPDVSGVPMDKDGDYQEKALAEASDRPELIGNVYENYKKIAGNRTTLIFAVNRKHAVHIHDEFKHHGVNVEYLDGETDTGERKAIKSRVESGQTKVVVNIGVMAFGTDWPRISCVIIARVTKNIAAWIQCIGRGSRLYPGKVDCLVIYHGDNFQELGRIDDEIEWSLDDKTTIKERKVKVAQEKKEPKDIACRKCGYVFRSSRQCPRCKETMLGSGEAIPYHEAELKEVTDKKEKFTSAYKENWYQEALGYCKKYNKNPGFAYHIYVDKFRVGPKWKKVSKEPSEDVIGFIKHRAIKKSKAA